jgi:hypothetical protein
MAGVTDTEGQVSVNPVFQPQGEASVNTWRPPISKANKSACPAAGTIVVGWPTNARNRGGAYR